MGQPSTPSAEITKLEYRNDTPYVPVPTPRLSWTTRTSIPDWRQAWAELDCDGDVRRFEGRDSVLVEWPFDPLAPREERGVRVRVGGEDGSVSEWSAPRSVIGGFLSDGEWDAEMVSLPHPEREAQPGLFRTEFEAGEVRRSTLYSTAQGVYQVFLNGQAVDEETLKPGWTSYQWRLIHETRDVTSLLRSGTNSIGIQLAGGWFCERYGFGEDALPFYGDQPSAALHLVIEYADGSSQTVRTDRTWRCSDTGPVIEASLYDGQHDDARKDPSGWAEPGFDDARWEQVAVSDSPTPLPRIAPPVRQIEEIAPVSTHIAPSGAVVLDFGQNISGRLRVRDDLPEGTTVTFRHAEVLDSSGELDRATMRAAKATDSLTSAGQPLTWEPLFTFRGFRYASVEGWVGDVPADAITAVALSSDLERTGWFESSDDLVNKLHESVVWSMRDNFVSLPSDCPQRAERLGWTGDIMWFSPTAATLFDVDGFLANWLRDVAAEQTDTGVGVPFVVPSPLPTVASSFSTPAAAWGDSATIVPWTLYQRYADTGLLEAQYESMTRWVDHVARLAGEDRLWTGGFQFGDWLDPFAPPEHPTEAKTDRELVATVYFFTSARLLSEMAAVLGHSDDHERYAKLAADIKAAFNAEYVTRNGRMTSDSQTAYSLAIVLGLAESDEITQRMGQRLAGLVREGGYHIGTGFAGTPYLTEALTVTGQRRAADRLLMQTESPSWLYPITMGATTTWEAWDSIRPDGTLNPSATSHNHYAFGSVVDWLYRSVAGLGPAEAGYRTITIAPCPLPSLDHARATHRTPYGLARVGWRRVGDEVHIEASIPPNTTARVELPDGRDSFEVGSGEHEWTVTDTHTTARVENLSLQTSLADIMEDPGAYAAVLAAFDRHVPRAGQALRTPFTHWRPGEPIEISIFTMPRRIRTQINEELAAYSPREASRRTTTTATTAASPT